MISSGSALRRAGPAPSRLTSAIRAGTATVALILAPSCSSRSGGGAAASPTPAAAKAAPEILHFGGDKTAILAGQTFHLTADFANGSAAIEPGDLVVTSGVPMTLTPDVTTTYTLTVTDSDGNKTVETASATVTPLNQGLALLAGELNGTGNVDGVGALARFRYPMGVALDPSGNVFVADTGNAAIRKITPDGTVSTLAGTAGILNPTRITADAAGNLYVVDGGSQISKIATDGTVTQVAAHDGDITTPHVFGGISDLAVNAAGTLFVVDGAEKTIEQISNGMVTTLAGLRGVSGDVDGASDVATFEYPEGIALDAAGNLYVADAGNHAIRLVTASPASPSGFAVKTLAGSPQNPGIVDGDAELATFGIISSLAVDTSGTIFVLDSSTIREIKDGLVTTMAGDPNYADTFDAVGTEAHFKLLSSLALDGEGNLYAADMADDVIRKITPEADTSTLAGKAERFISESIDGLGESANFYGPNGMATDALGNTYVADTHGNAIRKVSSTGYVTTLAGGLGFGYEDGQGAQALFNAPGAVAVDPSGNVYVTDNQNNLIRMITPQGKVSTLAGMRDKPGNSNGAFDAAQFNNMTAIAVDNAGYVYVTQPCAVRMLDPDNKTVTTLAGVADAYPNYVEGPANDARFDGLSGIAVDVKNGTVYVADQGNHRIRKITTSDGITSVALLAGSGEPGNQDGPSGSATFDHLNNLTLDSTGTYLYVTDGNLIRRISTADGSVTTEVGTRDKQGTMPGPLPGSLNAPQGVAWDPTGPGHLLISVPDAILRVTF